MPDVERIVGRIVAGAATPRDLAALRRGLELYPGAARAAGEAYGVACETAAAREAAALLAAALADDPAPLVGEGGVIRAGFSPELDEARDADRRRAPGPGRAGGGGARAHRHPLAARRLQPRLRLLHRGQQGEPGAGAGRLPAQADAGRRRALRHAAPQGARGAHPRRARGDRRAGGVAVPAGLRPAGGAGGRRCRQPWRAASPRSTCSAPWRRRRRATATCGPRSTTATPS